MKKVLLLFLLSIVSFTQLVNEEGVNTAIIKTEKVVSDNEIKDENRKSTEVKEKNLKKVKYTPILKAQGVYFPEYNYVYESKNLHVKHPLASLTKVMTAVVIMDYIKSGEIKLDDIITVKPRFVIVGGSRIATRAGQTYTVEQLLTALLVYSANNAAYMLADYVTSGDIDLFVAKMNEKARNLKMVNTRYTTPSGLPTNYTRRRLDISTINDQLILSKNVLYNYPEIMKIVGKKKFVLNNGYGHNYTYYSRNKIIGRYGNIGLKTGFHNLAGFNLIGIYNDGLKCIIVTFGDDSAKQRFSHQIKLNNQAKKNIYKLFDKNTFDKELNINGNKIPLFITQDVYFIKGFNANYKILLDTHLQKVKINEKVGEIKFTLPNGKIIREIPIYAAKEYYPKSFIQRNLKKIIILYFVILSISLIYIIYAIKNKRF